MRDPWSLRIPAGAEGPAPCAADMASRIVTAPSFAASVQPAASAMLADLAGEPTPHPKGTLLLEAGGPLTGLSLVERGWLIGSLSFPDGRRSVPRIFLPGDVIGLPDLALGHAILTVRSAEAGETRRVPRPRLLEALRTAPDLAENLLALAAQERAVSVLHLRAISRMTAAERLAFFFHTLLARLRQVDPGQGPRLHLPLSQTDLADHLGLTSVYVSRTLTTLTQRGIISRIPGGVVVHDENALAALAEGAERGAGASAGPMGAAPAEALGDRMDGTANQA